MNTFNKRSTADDVLAGLDLSNKTFLITGCASGIGFESMRALSARGATVIGLARTQTRADLACQSVSGDTVPIACEHSDFKSISAAIHTVRNLNTDIDAIIANAGIMTPPSANPICGVESQFFINHLSHMYFILGLEDKIKADTGRLVIVSSGAYKAAPKEGIDFDNLSGGKNYSPMKFYGQSKLANRTFANIMAKRLGSKNITANALHPGVITDTKLFRNTPTIFKWLAKLFNKSIAQGAATQCYLAAHPDLADVSGGYYSDCREKKANKLADDAEFQEKLWETSLKLIKQHAPDLPTSV